MSVDTISVMGCPERDLGRPDADDPPPTSSIRLVLSHSQYMLLMLIGVGYLYIDSC